MRNIIKRIIVGAGICLLVNFLTACEVNALVLSPYYGYTKTSNDQLGGWVSGGSTINTNVNDSQFAYATSVWGIGMAFEGLPNDGNSYTVYGSGVATNSGVVVMIYGSNTKFNRTNINSLLTYTNRVAVCYTSPTITGAYTSVSNFSNFTYYCSGLTGYSHYFIGIYDIANPTTVNGNVIGMMYSVSYAPSNEVDILNEIQVETEKQTQELEELNTNITNTDINGANTEAQNMLNAIDATDTTGLSGVITSPLRIINQLSNGCSPINLTIPFMDTDVSIPCMSTDVYPKLAGGGFIQTISVIINGFLIYRVIASLYAMIKGFRSPDEDKVEVVDL